MEVFFEIAIILVIAAGVSLVMMLLRQPLILGHIVTGILVGPAVLNLLQSQETIEVFSQLGITALLFIIGLTLSPQVIKEVGKVSLITGIGQIIFTSLFGYIIGIAFGFTPMASLYLAIAFTFSSTIIVSKLLADKKDLWQLHGKIAIGFLLVQDVIATLFLIFVATTAEGGSPLEIVINTGLKAVIVGAVLYVVANFVLPVLTKLFAKSQEFLFLFAIAWGVGLAAFFHVLGLSVELGALIAGVALASSPYHFEISSKMKLLRDFFIVMFFILLGSQLSYGNINEFLWPIIVFSGFILIGNPIIVMILMGLLRYSKRTSFKAGLTVAQISEFSLIMILIGIQAGHLDASYLSLATIVGMITISISSLMIMWSDELYRLFEPFLGIFERPDMKPERNRKETFDAILFGCHRVGSDFIPSLEAWGGKYLVVDYDPAIIDKLTKEGIRNRYGDAADNEFLDEINLKKLTLAISTIPDFESNKFLVEAIRQENPNTIVIALGHNIAEAEDLYEAGAHYVILPHFIGGNVAAQLVSKHGPNKAAFDKERMKHLKHLGERKGWEHIQVMQTMLHGKEYD